MSSTQFNKGPSYGLSAEVKNRLLSKYDPQKEAELRVDQAGLELTEILLPLPPEYGGLKVFVTIPDSGYFLKQGP